MRKILLLIIMLSSCFAYAQDFIVDKVQYGRQIEVYEDHIYVAGYTYKSDGYGTIAYLSKFDLDGTQQWSFKIDTALCNNIDHFFFYKGQIILSGTYGQQTNKTSDLKRYIKIMTLNKELVHTEYLGASRSMQTNFIVFHDKLYFGYEKSSSINYADMMYTSSNVVVEYDFVSHKCVFHESKLDRSSLKYIIHNSSGIFIAGEQYKDFSYRVTENYFSSIYSKDITNILQATQLEGLGRVVCKDNQFVMMTYSNPFADDQEAYLRFDYMDQKGVYKKTTKVLLKTYGWDRINLYLPYIPNRLWLFVSKSDGTRCYAELDTEGKVIQEIPAHGENMSSYSFAVTKNKVYHLVVADDITKVLVDDIKK